MRHLCVLLCALLLLSACGTEEGRLRQRAEELCRYVPDHELLEKSRGFMTEDFYAVLDTMFNLPQHEAMDHEWLYYFVTGNGGTIADYEVQSVTLVDDTHAVASVLVRQKWEDGSFDPETDLEEHLLYMERVDGEWLMSDFDGHKADCVRYIAGNRREQALREAVGAYLVREIGVHYRQGGLCVPVLMMVAEEDAGADSTLVYGDFWIFWYNLSGDTLLAVSGGNHAGCMTVCGRGDSLAVLSFEQTLDGAANEPSARRIFGTHYDIYSSMHSNDVVREAVCQEQLCEYVRRHSLTVRYFRHGPGFTPLECQF